MKLTRAYNEAVREVTIHWTNPIEYHRFMEFPEEKYNTAYYYKIVAKSPRTGQYKLLYIGKTDRLVKVRLREHRSKLKDFQESLKRHTIMISVGDLDYLPQRNWSLFVDKIETLLIYANADDLHLTNKKNIWSHNIKEEYKITNTGFRRDGMVGEIHLGVFFR